MRYLIRGAGIGLLAGALLFLFPFLLRFLLIALLISMIIRFFFGWGWRRHRGGYHSYSGTSSFSGYDDKIISIDGRGYVMPAHEKGEERRYPVG